MHAGQLQSLSAAAQFTVCNFSNVRTRYLQACKYDHCTHIAALMLQHQHHIHPGFQLLLQLQLLMVVETRTASAQLLQALAARSTSAVRTTETRVGHAWWRKRGEYKLLQPVLAGG
jgi:hypothetical protein